MIGEHAPGSRSRSCFTSFVEPSMSVNRKVTAPLGISVMTAKRDPRSRARPRRLPGERLSSVCTCAGSRSLAVRGLHAPCLYDRRAEERPHGHGDGERLRVPDALRPRRRVPARHDEEGALPVSREGAPLVPARRGQHPLAAGGRRHDLGRVGRRERRPRPGLRRPVAELADARRRQCRPDRGGRAPAPRGPRLAPDHRQRLERVGDPGDGTGAVPRVLPALRRGWSAQLPGLPAKRGRLPRRAVQHRELRAPDAHARAAGRPRRGRPDLDGRRLPRLRQPPRAGRDTARAQALSPSPRCACCGGRTRSSSTRSRTSRSSATSTTRESGRRLLSRRWAV